jgi:uncharacterized protein YjiS (DUF1127 family)
MGSQQMPAPGLTCPSGQPARRHAPLFKAVTALARFTLHTADTLLLWQERFRQRRALGSLSDHMLKDLGLSRVDTGRESGKRFWEG